MLREILWCLSNITAGTNFQIRKFLENESLVCKVYQCMNSSSAAPIQREAAYVICNLINSTDQAELHHHVVSLEDYLLLDLFAGLLKCNDPKVILEILEAIYILLCLDVMTPLEGTDKISYKLEKVKIVDIIEEYQRHPNASIYE